MTAVIVTCGDLSGREARRGTHASRPVRQRQPQPEFISTGHGARRAIFVAGAFSRVRGRLGVGTPCGVRGPENHGQPVPINFSRPLKASGGLSSFARIHLRQEQFRGEAPVFHVVSFPNAPELHEQHRRRRLECPTKALKDLTK